MAIERLTFALVVVPASVTIGIARFLGRAETVGRIARVFSNYVNSPSLTT